MEEHPQDQDNPQTPADDAQQAPQDTDQPGANDAAQAQPHDSADPAAAEADEVVVEDVQQSGEQAAQDEEPDVDPTGAIEAVLFSADSALTAARIAQVVRSCTQKKVREAIAALNEKYEQTNCAFRIEAIAGGYQMLTQPQYHEALSRLYKARSETKLTGAALETLSIVAYKQPILRADIEAIRGVASGEVLRGLMERQLVKIVGRADVVGRPMLYGTTKKFLETFGLASLEDLPKAQELRSLWSEPPKPAAPAAPADQETAPAGEEPAGNGVPQSAQSPESTDPAEQSQERAPSDEESSESSKASES